LKEYWDAVNVKAVNLEAVNLEAIYLEVVNLGAVVPYGGATGAVILFIG
jgi:hypothetical protein